ncbi:MAG TPA: di-heme oxidoredictase family protein [Polyangiaceae bacterium]|nr:di-heme oxidoredictase family protein [Polyangiaceae bacterium]
MRSGAHHTTAKIARILPAARRAPGSRTFLLLAAIASAALGSEQLAATASMPGDALPGITDSERARFERGRVAFETARDISTGLGPMFNDTACNRCHNRFGVGGAGIQRVTLVGRIDGDQFDPLTALGGPGVAANSVTVEIGEARRLIPNCKLSRDGEPIPKQANLIMSRRTTALFGLGLVDATPDATFIELAQRQPPEIRGRAASVHDSAKGERAVGKFGWKAKAASVRQFAGNAMLNEMGVTNPEYPDEQAPLGNPALLADCDVTPGLEDDGTALAALTDFVQMLAPIAPLEQNAEARQGDKLFTQLRCDGCHIRRLTSGEGPIAALANKAYAPFSDFLLHDMGAQGDRIGGEGDAAPREMRTAPLWGLRLSGPTYLHDGRARSLAEAVERHDGQGARSRDEYIRLPPEKKAALVAFLQTL